MQHINIFLENVAQGKQPQIEELLNGNPALALETGIVKDHSNRYFKFSAIQYATWALDPDMLEALVKNLTSEQKEQAVKQMEDLEINYAQYSQHGANSEPIILDLIKELKNYSDYESEESRCSRIGGVQRLLPINVINEFCNPRHHQEKSPNKLPRGIQVCIYHKVEASELYQPLFPGVPCFPSETSGLGSDFFLCALWPKYPLYLPASMLGQGVRHTTAQIIKDDIHNLNKLLALRKSKILEIKNFLKGRPVLKSSEENLDTSPQLPGSAIRKPQKEFFIPQPEMPPLRNNKCDYQFFKNENSVSVDKLTEDIRNMDFHTKRINTSSSWKLEKEDKKTLEAELKGRVEHPKEFIPSPSKKPINEKPTKVLDKLPPSPEKKDSQKIDGKNLPNKPKVNDRSKTAANVMFVPGLNYEEMNGNGHCLYSAVALYLGKDTKKLREEVANYLEKNLANTDIISVIEALLPQTQTIEDYISAIKNSAQWADGVEIAVLMEILNRPIVILGVDREIRNPHEISKFSGEPIFVLYNGHTHYDALLLDGSKSANALLIELQNKQNLQAAKFRSPVATNPYGMFTSQRQTIETLQQLAEISVKEVLNKPIVEIKFFDLNDAKQFQSRLMDMKITDSNMPDKPRKIETPQEGEYNFNLRPEEYYAISGDDSVVTLINSSTQNHFLE